MEWLIANWDYVMLGFVAAEKVVKLTPTKYDDIAVDIIWGTIREVIGRTKPKDE